MYITDSPINFGLKIMLSWETSQKSKKKAKENISSEY